MSLIFNSSFLDVNALNAFLIFAITHIIIMCCNYQRSAEMGGVIEKVANSAFFI